MMKKELPRFLYGGDYNPEQWPEETWAEDIKVFKQADINTATINVFHGLYLNRRKENTILPSLIKLSKN